MQPATVTYPSATAPPQTSKAQRPWVIAALAGAIKRLRRQRAINRAQWHLMGMSDRELKDVGLTRVQIFSAVRRVEDIDRLA